MNAREKVRAAKLRRIPADAFEAEARRRGYRPVPSSSMIVIEKASVRKMIDKLRSAIIWSVSPVPEARCGMNAMGDVLHRLTMACAVNAVTPEQYDKGQLSLILESEAAS